MGKKYVLNKTQGINGINKISLKKIIEIFSYPKDVEILLDINKITLDIKLLYDELSILYSLIFSVKDTSVPESQFLTFVLKKLYLDERLNIKIGDDLRTVLSKIKKILRKYNKNLDFKYEEDKYSGRYLFDDGNIDIFFQKYKNKKIVDDIMISLPYEDILSDNYIVDEIKDIMEIKNKIDSFFWESVQNFV
ncbi:hypothetical protein [Leptotrichia sp. oral taxon 847]|uniref:hypothetical protein n=1 Tax=Leptotrichia sp. oral taxon 847 TaxID=1785996 RepID=UPI000767F99C|nr:hypothetical protein [Leptotrichia sp. oral taxon 847]AMD96038.1 hypothetical protein AXF11_07815 [Leptotrichia sp. oral taxon 847]